MEIRQKNIGKEILEKIDKEKLKKICEQYHIIALRLFGSILTKNFDKLSDIDILVEFNPDHIPSFFRLAEIERLFSTLFKNKVDLRTKDELSKYFRDKVLHQSVKIYGN